MAIKKIDKGWLVDIRPYGVKGPRFRETFALKENAVAFERKKEREAEQQRAGVAIEMTLLELIDKYTTSEAIEHRGFKKSERYKLQAIRDYYAQRDKLIGDFGFSDANEYRIFLREKGNGLNTIRRQVGILKRIFSWAMKMGYVPLNPVARLELKTSKARCRWLTETEMEKIYQTIEQEDPDLWFGVFLARETGFRLSNVERLRPEDFKDGFVTALLTKSGDPYDVPCSSRLAEVLPSFKEGRVTIAHDLSRRFRNIIKAAGLYRGEGHPDNVTFHTLRHTFASYWLQQGVPIYTVAKWMGHASVTMTEHVYGHLSKKHHLDAMREFEQKNLRPILGGQKVDKSIIPFPAFVESASKSSCPQGESNPCFGLERTDKGVTKP